MSNHTSKTGNAKTGTALDDARLPLTVLTGFLGAGKTSLLNRYLNMPEAAGAAVLINEFGEIDIDGAVLSTALDDGSRMVTLPNGCVCCAVQEDLAKALLALAQRAAVPGHAITRCIIETTGLADPGAIIRGVGHDPALSSAAVVDLTLTVCAADQLHRQLNRFDEVARQIAIADRVIVTKSDLATAAVTRGATDAITAINPLAQILHVTPADTRPGEVTAMFEPAETRATMALRDLAHGHHHHGHGAVQTFTVRLARPLDPGRFRDVMSFMIMRHAENLLRVKGLVRFTGDSAPRLLNGVHDVFTSRPAAPETRLPTRGGAIVFIGVDLPEETIRSDLESCTSPPA